MSGLPFNKVCEIEDFYDSELADLMRKVCSHKARAFPTSYPRGAEYRKDWEVAMAVRALGHFGALRPDATILGVAVGTEDTLFYLTREVKQVFATDRYYEPGVWESLAPGLMLVEPGDVAPFEFDRERLVVQHMDGRWLRYPSDTFDGIFSSGSIEHFGELEDAAYSAYEMGRVLKPGGVLSLSTEFRLSGPAGGVGWPGRTLLFSPENIRRYIVEASGLTPVDDLRSTVSPATLSTPQDLDAVIAKWMADGPEAGPNFTHLDFPHVVLVKDDYVFSSVHLTLTKTDSYPDTPNEWAKPPRSLLSSISDYNRSVAAGRAGTSGGATAAVPDPPAAGGATVAVPDSPAVRAPELVGHQEAAESRLGSVRSALTQVDEILHSIDLTRDEADALLVTDLARVEAEVSELLAQPAMQVGESSLARSLQRPVVLPGGIAFTVVIDADLPDGSSRVLAAGKVLDPHVVDLMAEVLQPGDRMLDLGAHVGTFALAAAAAGCRVIAVEASPVNAALLRQSVWINGFHEVYVINAAVSDAPGTLPFHLAGPHGHVAWDDEEDAIAVPAVTVDELVRELGWTEVSFVKMDVEGYETRALGGMTRLLERPDAPPVLFESNGHTLAGAGTSPEELIALIEGFGYMVYLVEPRRLTRISSSDRQTQTIWDCLAVKRKPPGLDGWVILPSLTQEACVDRIVAESRHENPHCRAWVAGALASFPSSVRSHHEVTQALERLRHDPEAEVRARAAWSATDRAGAEAP